MQNLVNQLRWRGMVHDMVPGTEAHLNQHTTKGYIGFDPSAPSLHLGNLTMIMLLKHLQEAGHIPIAVIGGATGMIGDPSGRTQERSFLTPQALEYNQHAIKEQLSHFLDFSPGPYSAQLFNNLDWINPISLLSFLRHIGKHIPIGYMMGKDSVKQRIKTGISYTEFTYQLLQGYDFYHLYRHQGVHLQMGGSDQWGNLTTGVELIRKKIQGEAFALTAPLLTRSDGSKFGKTASGQNIWLDGEQTTPYQFYQFMVNTSDQEAEKLIRIFSPNTKEEVEALCLTHQKNPEKRILQTELAKLVTTIVHGSLHTQTAILTTEILFNQTSTPEKLFHLSEEELLKVCQTLPKIDISPSAFQDATSVASLVSEATKGAIFASKGEAKRMILSKGVQVNKTLVTDPHQVPNFTLLHHRYLLIQKGKKHHYLMTIS